MIAIALAAFGIFFTIIAWLWAISIGTWILGKTWKLLAFGAAVLGCVLVWRLAPQGLQIALAWGMAIGALVYGTRHPERRR